jgi:uncharacterized protein
MRIDGAQQKLSAFNPATAPHRPLSTQEQQEVSSTPSETLILSPKTEKTARVPIENLRPSEQHKTGLRGALHAVGGAVGLAASKALSGLKGPMMTTAWKDLLVASYEVPGEALQPYLPEGVELDSWNGKHYMSLVALHSKDMKGLGVRVPGGKNFEQVNLRFYVKRDTPEGEKKGVVFIKQVMPSPTVALASQYLVNERIDTASMEHEVPEDSASGEVSYHWNVAGRSSEMSARRVGQAKPLLEGSQEEFLLENYAGYATQSDGQTVEYKVEHPPWNTWQTVDSVIDVDAEGLYGKDLAKYLSGPPSSVVLVDGSSTAVHAPKPITGS